MAELLRVSGKDLGAMALEDFCRRCYWVRRHAPNGLPFQIFPGIFSSIDSFTKHVVHQHYDAVGPPAWLAPLGNLVGYRQPPSAHSFQVHHRDTGVLLTGAPDAVFERADGTLVIADYKTAKYTETQDELFPMYDVQLNAYAYIAKMLEWPPVTRLALIYVEPQTTPDNAAPRVSQRANGFVMSFKATVKTMPMDLSRIGPLLERFKALVVETKAPPSRAGCKDCAKRDGLIGVIQRRV
jgi:hypothetical protein